MKIIFYTLTNGDTIKSGWCHHQALDLVIDAILYQSSIPLETLKRECFTVSFRLSNGTGLGKYYFESGEFYPSEWYDSNPELASL